MSPPRYLHIDGLRQTPQRGRIPNQCHHGGTLSGTRLSSTFLLVYELILLWTGNVVITDPIQAVLQRPCLLHL